MKRRQNYEDVLPEGYRQVAHIRSGEENTGFLADIRAVWPGLLLVLLIWHLERPGLGESALALGIFAAGIYPYFAVHELTHGLVYRAMVGKNVKIGFSRTGAYCGIPAIYVYRTVAVRCTVAPLAVFSVLFGLGAAVLAETASWAALPLALLLTLHLLGCRSDVALLKALHRFKTPSLLVRDCGTEQWIYINSQ